jgi:hypothetical protein
MRNNFYFIKKNFWGCPEKKVKVTPLAFLIFKVDPKLFLLNKKCP